MKYCKKCGETFDDSYNFCSKCGIELLKDVKKPKIQLSKKRKTILLFCLIALLGVVVIGSAIMGITEYEKKRVYQNKLNAAVEYSSIGEFNDYDVAVVTKEYLDGSIGYGIINRKYEEVVPCIYSAIRDFYKGMASAELNGKYVVIDNKGQILEKDEYYKIFEGKYEHISKTINKDRLVGRFADGSSELLDINLVAISRTYSLIHATTSIRLEKEIYVNMVCI